MKREAEVTEHATDTARDIFFWAHSDGAELFNFGTHVTKFTPLWCERHEWAFDRECLACRKK